jgi:hypothetical protein
MEIPYFRIWMHDKSRIMGISQILILANYKFWNFDIEERVLNDTNLLPNECILAVTIFKFNERSILVKKDDFLKCFGYCPAPAKMQIYEHQHQNQCYLLFHYYLINNERFDNILLRFLK